MVLYAKCKEQHGKKAGAPKSKPTNTLCPFQTALK